MNPHSARLYPFRNLVLTGMPGAGKSTVGVLLAKALGMQYIDTDLMVQEREGCLLQDLVDRDGPMRLREVEAGICQDLDCDHCVIATGGSVVYSSEAMRALSSIGRIVWLSVPLEALHFRLDNLGSRGLARAPGQTIDDLLAEREPLYRRYAELTVECGNMRADEVVRDIVSRAAGNLAL